MRNVTLLCLFGPGELPMAAAEALVDLGDVEVAMLRGSWGWSLRAQVPNAADVLPERLADLARIHGCDHAVVTGPLATLPPQLIVMDVDSTLTTTEAIDLLAAEAGVGEAVAAVTERAMRGELDFAASLAERVAALEGLDEAAVERARQHVGLQPGALELARFAHVNEIPIALVSGGFAPFVRPLAELLPASHWAANTLEVVEGRLTGRVVGEVVDRAAKERHLREYAVALGVEPARVVAIGDGANDLDMLAAAGLGIAYCAKPVTAAEADVAITFPRLDAALAVLVAPDSLAPQPL